ncbi:MAG: putative nucleotidyltransferase [Patescibacteria group bacterium]|jgi:predicted nucleotidyltransferase
MEKITKRSSVKEEAGYVSVIEKSDTPSLANIGQNWQASLIPFTNNYDARLTASEISRKIGVPNRTVSRVLSRLVTLNLIRYLVEGKNKKYFLNADDERARLVLVCVEAYKSLLFIMEQKKVWLKIHEVAQEVECVLFGSYAKGISTKDSDIDLLIIGERSEKLNKIISQSSITIHVHYSSMKEFEKKLKQKNTLTIEILRDHVIFGGTAFVDVCWRYYYG